MFVNPPHTDIKKQPTYNYSKLLSKHLNFLLPLGFTRGIFRRGTALRRKGLGVIVGAKQKVYCKHNTKIRETQSTARTRMA